MKTGSESAEDGARRREVVVIKRPFVSPQRICDRCSEPSGMITPDEAAALFDVSTRTIYRWLESDTIHFSEGVGEGLLICLVSLAAVKILTESEPFIGLCERCGTEVSWLTPNQVAALTGLTLREVFRLEANTLHFNESEPGVLLICPKSLGLK